MQKKILHFLNSSLLRFLIGVYIVLVSIVIIFSINIFSPYYSFTNKSDSMAPLINRGSLTIVKDLPSYEVGDAVAYYALIDSQEEIITHRIKSIGGNVYTTKGDANEVADRELVKPRLVIGKVVFIIPYLGYFISFSKSLLGSWLMIIFPAYLIIFCEIIKIVFETQSTPVKKNKT